MFISQKRISYLLLSFRKWNKFVLFDPLIDLISAILARKHWWPKKQRGVSELEKRDL
jgi:hypothetical protein